MAAFRIKDSTVYRLEPTIPGIGKLPRMSSGTRDRKVAEAMEAALLQLAQTGYADLIEQLRDGEVRLAEVWAAHMKPKTQRMEALEALRTRKDDPLLTDAVPERKERARDARVKNGYDQLALYAPANARVSWLAAPANLSDLYERATEGRAANSVRRSLHRAVCDLLTKKYGRGRMLAIIAEVTVPGEKDERQIEVTREEIAMLVDPAYSDTAFVNCVGFILTTGIDRAPMQRLTPTSVDEHGIITVHDTKNATRFRRFKLDDEALRFFNLASAGKGPLDKVFPYTDWQLRDLWEHLRARIKRPELRWKDLRAVFATYYLAAGGSPKELQHILGHTNAAMTLRYIKRMSNRESAPVGEAMGLGKTRLKVERNA